MSDSSLGLSRTIQAGILLFVALALPSASVSQQVSATQTSLAMVGIGHVAIRTSNLANTRAFFEKLGFLQAFELTKNGVPTEEFIKISDRQFLELYPAQGDQSPGYMHLCFDVDDLEELNAAYTARGLTPTPVRKAGAGNLLFVLYGPEQQTIEFTQYMPGSMHTEDRGKHLGDHRIAILLTGVAQSLNDPMTTENYYVQRLGFSSFGVREGARVVGLPGVPEQAIGLLRTGSKPAFALVFSVDDLGRTEQKLRTAGLTPTRRKDLVMIDGPEDSLVVFISNAPR